MTTQLQTEQRGRAGDSRDPRRWWALAALSLALFMAILDNTVVNVALPHIQTGLKTSISDLQWVVSAYSLVFGSLLISGGKLGDLLGRKRVFLTGLTLFIGGSVLSGLAPNITLLHVFRAMQGLGGAAIFPLTLAIINSTFEGKERATAISLWGGISGLAVALGPVIGGLLVDNVSWRAVFFVNVPFGLLVGGLALYAVRDSRDTTAKGGIDWLGTALSTAALFAIIFALIRTDAAGWEWGTRNNVATLAAGFVLMAVFLATEFVIARRGGEPMVDLTFFRNPIFSAANAVAFLVSLAMFGAFFYVSIYLQSVLGYSAMGAGMRTLPVAAGVMLGAPISGQLAGRFGPRWPLSIGMLTAGIGVFMWATMMGPAATYTDFVWALPVFGFGMGIVFPAIGTAILNTVSRDKSGVATGINDMSREVGGTFGIALMAAIFNPIYHSGLADRAAHAGLPATLTQGLRDGAGTGANAAGIPAELAHTVHTVVQSAFVSGMQTVLHVSTVLLVAGAIVAFTFMRGARATEDATEGEEELQYAAAD
jgi:EmrB/QacA subfamily drug resistance transporter